MATPRFQSAAGPQTNSHAPFQAAALVFRRPPGIIHRLRHCLPTGRAAPRAIRHRLRDAGDPAGTFRGFGLTLAAQAPALEHVAETCVGNVVLLCFERDYQTCHRSSVARELGRLADRVPVHLEAGDLLLDPLSTEQHALRVATEAKKLRVLQLWKSLHNCKRRYICSRCHQQRVLA